MTDHYFERAANPRLDRSCARCGRLPGVHPDRPVTTVDRDLIAEGVTVQRAWQHSRAVHAAEIWNLANERAMPGGVTVAGRDFLREVREELADALNYLVWLVVYELEGTDRDGQVPIALGAMGKLFEAWELLS